MQAYEQLQYVIATGKLRGVEPTADSPVEKASKGTRPQSAQKQNRRSVKDDGGDSPPQAEDQSIRDVFNCVAQEHGTPGTIPSSEVGTVLQMLGVQLDVSQLFEAVKQLDSGETGKIALKDFLIWVKG